MSRPLSMSGLPLPSSMGSIPGHGASASSAASSSTSSAIARQASLTEELDKLEQSITLTLQEIDHNFSQCHRIVTHSIMPVIERYTEQSRNVNDGARFWKQFFEFSANVSIGSYESRIEDETGTEETHDTTFSHDTLNTAESSEMAEHPTESTEDDSILPPSVGGEDAQSFDESSTEISTPKPSAQMRRWANIESPYETLRKELNLGSVARSMTTAEPSARKLNFKAALDSDDDSDDSPMPKPPEMTMHFPGLGGATSAMKGMQIKDDDYYEDSSQPTTPDSIRHPPGSHRPKGRMLAKTPETAKKIQLPTETNTAKRSKNDLLLHRAVDTNWRLQATPLVPTTTPKRTAKAAGAAAAAALFDDDDDDDSPFSSPAPPQITAVLPAFDTPPGGAKRGRQGYPTAPHGGPKTPTSNKKLPAGYNFNFDDDDDDDDDDLGFSPPVTMQFTLPPSKLMQTPAKEASRKLVREIMASAGLDPVTKGLRYTVDDDTTTTDETRTTLDSPTILRGGEPTDGFLDF